MTSSYETERQIMIERFRGAVTHDLPHPFRVVEEGRPASVLLLVGFRDETGEPEVLITRRPESIGTHKGQYALPGGMRDTPTETAEETALRETREEMGILPDWVEVIGRLPVIWTPSGFTITPVIGVTRTPIAGVTIDPSPAEIDFWFWCPLARLRESGVYRQESRSITHEGITRAVPIDVYEVDEHRIWGATGAILRNFIARLEKCESGT